MECTVYIFTYIARRLILFSLIGCGSFTTIVSVNKETYTSQMDILEINIVKERICLDDQQVSWGVYRDTLAISYGDVSLIFYAIKYEVGDNEEKQIKRHLANANETLPYAMHFALQDRFDEKYFIIIIPSPLHILIHISNIDRGYPSYVLCTNCEQICD